MNQLGILAAVAFKREEPPLPTYEYVWDKLEGPGLAIIVILILLSRGGPETFRPIPRRQG